MLVGMQSKEYDEKKKSEFGSRRWGVSAYGACKGALRRALEYIWVPSPIRAPPTVALNAMSFSLITVVILFCNSPSFGN
ncbi:hypothetical protein SLA2020_379510 [Shorea laevis]